MIEVCVDFHSAFNAFRLAMHDDLGLTLFNIRSSFTQLIQIIGNAVAFLIA